MDNETRLPEKAAKIRKKSEENEKALKVPRFFQRLFTPPIGDLYFRLSDANPVVPVTYRIALQLGQVKGFPVFPASPAFSAPPVKIPAIFSRISGLNRSSKARSRCEIPSAFWVPVTRPLSVAKA